MDLGNYFQTNPLYICMRILVHKNVCPVLPGFQDLTFDLAQKPMVSDAVHKAPFESF